MADLLLIGESPIHDNDGAILAAGSVTFYRSGTTTLATIYSDSAAATPLANPVTIDASGRIPNVFFADSYAVRVRIRDIDGVLIRDIDPIARSAFTNAGASNISFAPVSGNAATNVQDAIENNTTGLTALGTPGDFAPTLVATDTAAEARTALGLGTMALEDSDDFGLAQATWNAGSGTTARLISPTNLNTTQNVYRNANSLGWGQTWQSPTRVTGTAYQNTTNRPIQVAVSYDPTSADGYFEVSATGAFAGEEIRVAVFPENTNLRQANACIIIPDDYYYRVTSAGGSPTVWAELR